MIRYRVDTKEHPKAKWKPWGSPPYLASQSEAIEWAREIENQGTVFIARVRSIGHADGMERTEFAGQREGCL